MMDLEQADTMELHAIRDAWLGHAQSWMRAKLTEVSVQVITSALMRVVAIEAELTKRAED